MIRRACVVVFALAASACAVGPDYVKPEVVVPVRWSGQSTPLGEKVPVEWWRRFHDAELNRLIAEATAASLDLQQATARIRDARAQRATTLAAALPSVDVLGNLSRRRNNFGAQGASGAIPFAGGGFGNGQQRINIFQMGFDANWELDFFGGVQRALEAGDATLEAEVENRRAVLVSLLGEVARRYIDLRANQRLLAVTRDNLRAQRDILALTQSRQRAGLGDMQEVARQESEVAALQARLPEYEAAVEQAIHALGVLLGRTPDALSARLRAEGPLPMASAEVAADLPSTLLQRRPDIRRAERQLAAATAQVGVATSDLYPKINLAAFLGLQNTRITDFTPLGKSWSMASSLSMPLFNWGRLQARITGKEAQRDQSLLAYRATILTAFREVEDALVAHNKERERKTALAQAVEAGRLAVELADERYRMGLTSFLDVLDARRALHEAESRLVESEAKVSANLVALYKALGGGWETGPDAPRTASGG
jgi:NodT family efflux transporter outer membrane factor (OMF) lipoprotein